MKSILVILIAGIGDLILSTKALRALRLGHPDVDIHLLTSTQSASLAENYEYIDHVWNFPIRELRKDRFQFREILELIRRLRKIDFDAVINLYRVNTWMGSFEMGLLFTILKGEQKIGHDSKGFGLFLDKKIGKEFFRNRHFADAMMEIVRVAGGIPDEKGIEVFWSIESESKWRHLFTDPDIMRVAINPGGERANRRWNPDNYALVADNLIDRFNAKIFILGGPGEEKIAEEILIKMRNEVIDLSGQLKLNDLVYIIDRMDLLVTNDSAPMHIAAAVKTPVVAIFGPEDPRLFGPYTTRDLYRIVFKDVDCRPCKKKDCKRPICLDQITPKEVFEKCVEILKLR
jgi:lipopolysaccharide heptosyltransferase II